MKKVKCILTKIKCFQIGIKYMRGMWIHPSVEAPSDNGCIKLSEGVILHKGVRMDMGGGTIVIGENMSVNTYTRIEAGKRVVLGKNVLIGPNVYISDRSHAYQDINEPIKHQGYVVKGDLEIGDNTWIGIHACIIGKAKIGKGCVVGANAVITKDIPDYCVVVGNPGRIIRHYNAGQQQWEKV